MTSTITDNDSLFDRFYTKEDPEITDQTKTILTQYSNIPEQEIVRHIREIRDRAWAIYKYPCIGQYSFLHFSISTLPEYPEILSRLTTPKGNQTLLDLGCCFGQDVRKLVFDGAPAASITGSELEAAYVSLGYELFKDRDRLASRFLTGDFLAEGMAGLQAESFDMVHAGAFFHLFSWADQVEAVERTVGLLKPKPGSMLFGRQTGVDVPGVVKHASMRSGEMYRHDLESWEKLMDEVREKSGLTFESRVEWVGPRNVKVQGYEWTRMAFCIRLV